MMYLILLTLWLFQTTNSLAQKTQLSRVQLDMGRFSIDLRNTASKLREREPDIAEKLEELAKSGAETAKKFTETISNRGKDIRDNTKYLKRSEVTLHDLKKFGSLLSDTKDDLSSSKNNIRAFENGIHENLAFMNERIIGHTDDASVKLSKANILDKKTQDLSERIRGYEVDANNKESVANDYSSSSYSEQRDANGNFVWGLAWGAVGALAAPWLGLYSLVPAAASVKKLFDSSESQRLADQYDKQARRLWIRVWDLRREAETLRIENGEVSEEAKELKRTAEDLEKAAKELEVASTSLRNFIEFTDKIGKSIQNIETTIKQTTLSIDTIEHILSDHQADQNPIADEVLSKFRESLEVMEKFLNPQTTREFLGNEEEEDRH